MLKSNIFIFVVTCLASPGKTTGSGTLPTEDFQSFFLIFLTKSNFLVEFNSLFLFGRSSSLSSKLKQTKNQGFLLSVNISLATDLPAAFSGSDQSKIISFINEQIK